ncbi:hypothetical protein BJ742DRAFT_768218 [Cladochytrium replicatum]|nr:hypothetical protein BJ742DRAFT_768218 [Cladochytrium replicatum]
MPSGNENGELFGGELVQSKQPRRRGPIYIQVEEHKGQFSDVMVLDKSAGCEDQISLTGSPIVVNQSSTGIDDNTSGSNIDYLAAWKQAMKENAQLKHEIAVLQQVRIAHRIFEMCNIVGQEQKQRLDQSRPVQNLKKMIARKNEKLKNVDRSPVTPEDIAILSVFHNGQYSLYIHGSVYAVLGLLDVAVTVEYNREFSLAWNEFPVELLRNGKISLDVDLEEDKGGRTTVPPIHPPEYKRMGALRAGSQTLCLETEQKLALRRVGSVELDGDGMSAYGDV